MIAAALSALSCKQRHGWLTPMVAIGTERGRVGRSFYSFTMRAADSCHVSNAVLQDICLPLAPIESDVETKLLPSVQTLEYRAMKYRNITPIHSVFIGSVPAGLFRPKLHLSKYLCQSRFRGVILVVAGLTGLGAASELKVG
jgi:hypothetical protein